MPLGGSGRLCWVSVMALGAPGCSTSGTMSVQSSPLKRASRSLAKTGLFGAPFLCLFPSLFFSGFLGVLGRSFWSLGLHFELILEPFR